MSSIANLKISISGVRGVIGETLTPKLISSFAASFGQFVGKGSVIVGRDTRPTGAMVEQAVIAGLLSVGCKPVLAGVVSTPTVQVLVDHYRAVGGIAITASHNPMPWNAMKFINGRGMFLDNIEARQVLDIYNQEDYHYVSEATIQEVSTLEDAFVEHQRRIFKHINVDLIRSKKFKVAMDCGNGAGALYAQKFLEDLGCEVLTIFDETDGLFRRKPEPIPAHLTELEKVVKANGCVIGFAQDPDADRLVLVDDSGTALNENYTLGFTVKHLLKQSPGPVTINLGTSKMISDLAEEAEQELIFTKIGEINVSTTMLRRGSDIGGEGNGGVIWPKVRACRDSFTGMALVLELLADSAQSSSQIVESMPKYYGATRKIALNSDKVIRLLAKLKDKYADENLNTLDGVRIDWADKWVIVRASNTEPIVRLQAEAKTEADLEALLEVFVAECESV